MRRIISKKQAKEIPSDPEPTTLADSTSPPAENNGRICIATKVAEAGNNEADADILANRVKRFDNPDDMIASLKQPW